MNALKQQQQQQPSMIVKYWLLIFSWLDSILCVMCESVKTYLREVFRFGSQVLSFFSVIILKLIHSESYEFQRKRRSRIANARRIKFETPAQSPDFEWNDDLLEDFEMSTEELFENTTELQDEDDDDDIDEEQDEIIIDEKQRQNVWIEEDNDDTGKVFLKNAVNNNSNNMNNNNKTPSSRNNIFDAVVFGKPKSSKLAESFKPSSNDASNTTRTTANLSNKLVQPTGTIRQDTIHRRDVRTGLLEDALITSLLAVEYIFGSLRSIVAIFTEVLSSYGNNEKKSSININNENKNTQKKSRPTNINSDKSLIQKPMPLLRGNFASAIDIHSLITNAGYPHQRYRVITDDGYVLTLDRLFRPRSKRTLFLQHGIFDSAYGWLAAGTSKSLAFRAFDAGFDVFLGNLRGTQFSRGHVEPGLSRSEYWDFCVDDHAAHDLPAFLDFIHELKQSELQRYSANNDVKSVDASEEIDIDVTCVAHSMGACCVLAHLVQAGLRGHPTGISRAILLAPAGYHATAPLICKLTGPLINLAVKWLPIHVLQLPFGHRVIAKLLDDVRASSGTSTLMIALLTRLLGGPTRGSVGRHPFTEIASLSANMINAATSARVFRQFWQCWKHGKFEAYDYGEHENQVRYGTKTPLNYMEQYNVIDIPVTFVMGLDDRLIGPQSVIGQYQALIRSSPDAPSRTFLKGLPELGHIELTLAMSDEVLRWILEHAQSSSYPLSSSSSSAPSSCTSTPSSSTSLP